MRLGELFGTRVLDEDGRPVGRVRDVRLVQDGPAIRGFGAALRLDGLIVASGRVGVLAVRLGYHRRKVNGPYLLDRFALAMERGARFVPWDDVVEWEDGVVRLRRAAADLPPLRVADPA